MLPLVSPFLFFPFLPSFDWHNSDIVGLREKWSVGDHDVVLFSSPVGFDPCIVEIFVSIELSKKKGNDVNRFVSQLGQYW